MNETMNLHEYYRNHKDAINASIMDIACDLAVGRLLNAHGAPFETFVEADDPDDPDGGTHYKEEYQKEYDTYYDKVSWSQPLKFSICPICSATTPTPTPSRWARWASTSSSRSMMPLAFGR